MTGGLRERVAATLSAGGWQVSDCPLPEDACLAGDVLGLERHADGCVAVRIMLGTDTRDDAERDAFEEQARARGVAPEPEDAYGEAYGAWCRGGAPFDGPHDGQADLLESQEIRTLDAAVRTLLDAGFTLACPDYVGMKVEVRPRYGDALDDEEARLMGEALASLRSAGIAAEWDEDRPRVRP